MYVGKIFDQNLPPLVDLLVVATGTATSGAADIGRSLEEVLDAGVTRSQLPKNLMASSASLAR